jgi:hypothetical protein
MTTKCNSLQSASDTEVYTTTMAPFYRALDSSFCDRVNMRQPCNKSTAARFTRGRVNERGAVAFHIAFYELIFQGDFEQHFQYERFEFSYEDTSARHVGSVVLRLFGFSVRFCIIVANWTRLPGDKDSRVEDGKRNCTHTSGTLLPRKVTHMTQSYTNKASRKHNNCYHSDTAYLPNQTFAGSPSGVRPSQTPGNLLDSPRREEVNCRTY